jgi:Fe-Mn family superoxide dismutase
MNKLAQTGEDYEYTISQLRRRLGFEWNGMHLHEIYFDTLVGGTQTLLADTALYKQLTTQYGGFNNWLAIFEKVNARGPGWSILNYDPEAKRFFHTWVADHEIGQLATLPALLVVDHWEHAYLVDYKPSEKASYVEAYLNAVNWETVAARFDAAIK